ncbi:hypothetical protein C8R42DRAFT_711306 [Lentinula raphanica]|nr:hypothetical protein C8R42DRAFT_711306 [Lentinula raphanica]
MPNAHHPGNYRKTGQEGQSHVSKPVLDYRDPQYCLVRSCKVVHEVFVVSRSTQDSQSRVGKPVLDYRDTYYRLVNERDKQTKQSFWHLGVEGESSGYGDDKGIMLLGKQKQYRETSHEGRSSCTQARGRLVVWDVGTREESFVFLRANQKLQVADLFSPACQTQPGLGDDGRSAAATLGKGRREREVGKDDGFRLATVLGLMAAPVCWDAPAKGDETKGRGEIVNEAIRNRTG